MHAGRLMAGTPDNGLSVLSPKDWGKTGYESCCPRALIEQDGKLYVRGAYGDVSRFDGKEWKDNVFQDLPRSGEASALATDGTRIYAGQWGGWSEYDGKTWTHRLRGVIYAGTFHDGLAYRRDGKLVTIPELKTRRISQIMPSSKGGVLLAIADGVYHFNDGRLSRVLAGADSPDRESTSLCQTDQGLWIGTRTGILFKAGQN